MVMCSSWFSTNVVDDVRDVPCENASHPQALCSQSNRNRKHYTLNPGFGFREREGLSIRFNPGMQVIREDSRERDNLVLLVGRTSKHAALNGVRFQHYG